MDLLGDLSEKDCSNSQPMFEKGEIVEFLCVEPRDPDAKGHIFIKSKVLSGIHAGKDYSIMIAGGDHEASRKRKAMFFFKSGFWTAEELKAKTFSLQQMVGHKFQGKASKVTERDGTQYQNIDDIKDLGIVAAANGNGATAPTAAAGY